MSCFSSKPPHVQINLFFSIHYCKQLFLAFVQVVVVTHVLNSLAHTMSSWIFLIPFISFLLMEIWIKTYCKKCRYGNKSKYKKSVQEWDWTKKSARGFNGRLLNLIKWWHAINGVSIINGIHLQPVYLSAFCTLHATLVSTLDPEFDALI